MNPMVILFIILLNKRVGVSYQGKSTVMLIRFYAHIAANYPEYQMGSYFDILKISKLVGLVNP